MKTTELTSKPQNLLVVRSGGRFGHPAPKMGPFQCLDFLSRDSGEPVGVCRAVRGDRAEAGREGIPSLQTHAGGDAAGRHRSAVVQPVPEQQGFSPGPVAGWGARGPGLPAPAEHTPFQAEAWCPTTRTAGLSSS